MGEYIKDFDRWNTLQKEIDSKITNSEVFFREQEIWWCALGVNIGSEQDGKNDSFERPVLIIRKISKDLIFIAPLTTKIRPSKLRITISYDGIESQVLLVHSRTISSSRLLRKIRKVKRNIFQTVLIGLIKWILDSEINETPPQAGNLGGA